jgi:CRISPR-associated endonuclease/helicase Cas3
MDPGEAKPDGQLDEEKPLDPVYGNAMVRTWAWLNRVAEEGVVDFGIDAFQAILEDPGKKPNEFEKLLAPSALQHAPVLLPAHLDFWVQTNPRPAPDPDVSLFLHGPRSSPADVEVCWRADLADEADRDEWIGAVGLLPPTSAECMPIPFHRVKRWLQHAELPQDADLLGAPVEEESDTRKPSRARPIRGVIWRGRDDAHVLEDPGELRPGDTLVLPASTGGWEELGHIPGVSDPRTDSATADELVDVAEEAVFVARGKPHLRLHRDVFLFKAGGPDLQLLLERLRDPEDRPTKTAIRETLLKAAEHFGNADAGLPGAAEGAAGLLKQLAAGPIRVSPYPGGNAFLLSGPVLREDRVEVLDDGDDSWSRIEDGRVGLEDHLGHVSDRLDRLLKRLGLGDFIDAFRCASQLHDLGKADERFQAMLIGADRTAAQMQPRVWAKSAELPDGPAEWERLRQVAGLPKGFRHELLSVQLAERHGELPGDELQRDLALHLIAAHHGRTRPFGPVVPDENPPDVTVDSVHLSAHWRKAHPPHRLDSGMAERFWRLTRVFGWWGLAYLEAVLRLADQQASAKEARHSAGQIEREEIT